MRLRKCRFVNFGGFVDWTLDTTCFRDDQKLIALEAPNGTGKSTALEHAMIGAPYLNTPTQGTPAKRATAADSMLESVFVHGGPEWTVRHLLDGLNGGGHSVVLRDGELLHKKAGPKQLREWAELHLPPRSVVEASLVRFQTSEGFVQMDGADRMAVLLRVIGVERLERKAKIAREKAADEQKKLDEALRQIADVRGNDPGVEDSAAALVAAQAAAADAEGQLTQAKAALVDAQQRAADRAARVAAREAADQLLATLKQQQAGARAREAAAATALAKNRETQADADAIRAAAAALPEAERSVQELRAAWSAAEADIRAQLDPWRDGPARLAAARQRRAGAIQRLADASAIRAAVAELPALRTAATEARAAVADAERVATDLQHRDKADDQGRIKTLRGAHIAIVELPDGHLVEAQVVARTVLDADDQAVRDAIELPKLQAAARVDLRAAQDRASVADRKLADAEKLVVREPDLAVAETDMAAAIAEIESILVGHAAAVIGAVLRAVGRLDVAAAGAAAAKVVAEAKPLAARLPALEASEGLIAQLEPQLAAAQAELAELEPQILAVKVEPTGDPIDQRPAQQAVDQAEAAAKSAREAVTKAELALARSREIDAKLEGKLAERADIEAELADWTRLAIDHGRTGLQSDEVDAAGPELTGYLNGCLRACVGTRWTMEVETQQLDSKGKELLDKLVIMVIDNKKGTRKEVKLHSGGERTTLAEAIASGLTMLGCRRAGFERPTLVRDESANFLDPQAAIQWVKMMRHVVEFTNADRLLFVSHNPAVVKLADAVITVPEQLPANAPAETAAA